MKALCFVAHPDDCAIFAYHFINLYKNFQWHIEYLTYNQNHSRGMEVKSFWEKRSVTTDFCNFSDNWNYVSRGEIGFSKKAATDLINEKAQGYNLILTHNSLGEYGHPHHLLIHNTIKELSTPKVYFGTYPDICNKIYQLESPAFDYTELPVHANVLRDCDLTNWKYFITPEAENLLQYSNG